MRCVSENHHSPLPPNTLHQHLYIFSSGGDIEVKWWGKIPRPSSGDIGVKWWGTSKAKWWGYRGQLVGEIIKVKWWGYLGQVVGISRSSGGDIKVRGRGLEVKVKKSGGGACPLQLPLLVQEEMMCSIVSSSVPQILHL
jgi:hypothetical protein